MIFKISTRDLDELEELLELDEVKEEFEQLQEQLQAQVGSDYRVSVTVSIRTFPTRRSRKTDE